MGECLLVRNKQTKKMRTFVSIILLSVYFLLNLSFHRKKTFCVQANIFWSINVSKFFYLLFVSVCVWMWIEYKDMMKKIVRGNWMRCWALFSCFWMCHSALNSSIIHFVCCQLAKVAQNSKVLNWTNFFLITTESCHN